MAERKDHENWRRIFESAAEEAAAKRRQRIMPASMPPKSDSKHDLAKIMEDIKKETHIFERGKREQAEREAMRRKVVESKREDEKKEKLADMLEAAAKRAALKRNQKSTAEPLEKPFEAQPVVKPPANEEIEFPVRTDKNIRKVKPIRFQKNK